MIGKNELAEITRLFGFPCDLPEVEATMHSQVIGGVKRNVASQLPNNVGKNILKSLGETTMEKILEKKQIIFECTVKEITEDVCGDPTKYESENATFEKSFADCSWAEFVANARAGKVRKFYNVGDMKTIELKTGELIRVAIAGFDHDIAENGSVLPVTLTFVDCLNEGFPMNMIGTNIGGWKDCEMRNKVMREIFERLPDDLKNFIATCKKDDAYLDKLFLPSEVEVWGKNIFGKDDVSNKQYEFYKNKYNRVKFRSNKEESSTFWWLRNPFLGNSKTFCVITSGCSYNYYGASNNGGIAPCFAIG